jgi:hypothetical protein
VDCFYDKKRFNKAAIGGLSPKDLPLQPILYFLVTAMLTISQIDKNKI